jgi:MFS transporter, ACDE family, multidrug resistance protein
VRRAWALVVLSGVGFVTTFGAHIVAVNLPVYAGQVGLGALGIGLLIAVYDFAEVFAKPISGYIADRRGKLSTMIAGLAVFSLASLLYLFVDPRLLIVIRLLQGLGAAAFSVVSLALVAECFSDARGRALGIYNAVKGAGYVLSPLIGGAIVVASSFATVFVACAVAGVVALALSLTLREPARTGDHTMLLQDDDDFSLRQALSTLGDRTLAPWYATIVVNMFFVGILFGFLAVYANSLGYDQARVGLVVSLCTLAYLLVQPVSGILADRFSPAAVILAGLILSGGSVVILPFTEGPSLALTAIVAGLGVGAVWTNCDTMVSRLADPQNLASAMGAAGSFKEIGDMLGPVTIGVLAQAAGLRTGFVVCGLMGLVAAAILARQGRQSNAWSTGRPS